MTHTETQAMRERLNTLRAQADMLADTAVAAKDSFEAYIRDMRRPDIGSDADDLTEQDFVSDLGEDGWPDSCRWREIFCDLSSGAELTTELRKKALAYWFAGEEHPPIQMRLDPCGRGDCPLRSLTEGE